MDDNFPTLKRPKKKLVYPTTKTRVPDQWTQDINTLEDVDKMFDNLDSNVEDFPSPSPEIHIPNINKCVEGGLTPLPPLKELLKCQMGANGDQKHPHLTPASPELDINSETPFKIHGPVKTSSPIEGNVMQPQHHERNNGDNSASPILFDCEDDNEKLETAERLTEKPQHNNKRDESDDSIFETLPKKSALDKMSTQKKKTVPARSKPTNMPVRPVRSEKKAAPSALEKTTESVQLPAKAKGDMGSFLQRLREAKQPKHTLAGISHARVLPPLPEPEPEDDFLILEDDVPFYVSIPNKYSKSTKEKRTKTSCSDTEAKGTAGEEHSADKQQDNEQDHRQESETLTGKTNINKGSESNPVATDKDLPPLDTIESDNVERLSQRDQTKKKKKRQLKKVPSKDDGKPEDSGTETNDGISSKKIVRGEKNAKKGSKPLTKDKENVQRKTTGAKENRRGQRTEGVEAQKELNSENQFDNDAPVSGVSNVETEPTEDVADVNLGQNKPSSQEQASDEEGVILKRKRKPPGEWWLCSPDQNQDPKATEKQPTVKKTKRTNKRSSSASVKAATGGGRKNLKPSSSSDSGRQKAEKNKVKKGKRKSNLPIGTSEQSDEVFGQPIQDRALDSSPLMFVHRERSMSSGERAFHKVYQSAASERKSSSPNRASPMRPEGGVLGIRETPRRRRKSPGDWWQVNPTADDQEVAFSEPQPQKSKKKQIPGNKKRQADQPLARSPSKPLEGAPKQKKRSLAATRDLFSRVVGSLPGSRDNVVPLKKQKNVTAPPAEDVEANHNVVSTQMDELQGAQDKSPSQDTAQESVLKMIRSGPSSMIGLENYEEDDNTVLPSTTVQPALCVSDLCSAPFRPLTLQPKDEVNLRNWLKSLWPAAERNTEVTPGDFEWYCYHGKAMGILVDLQTATICTGKMLLGSSLKKPLWVDHSATTVFNLLTGSVRVIVDCNKSLYNAGQSFMVPPGHAYSIHNLSAQPVVLYFTRFFTDESNE